MNGTSKRPARMAGAITLLGLMSAAAVTVAEAPAHASGTTWQITNYDNDGTQGVYGRNSANINDVNRVAANYYTYGTSVQELCYLMGSAVGPYANQVWYQVKILTGPNAGQTGKYVSAHWTNDTSTANHPLAGLSQCGTSSTTGAEQAAITWARAQADAHSTAYSGLCLSFVRNAYLQGGVDLKSKVNVAWGSNTYPSDIWGHFTSGTTGTGTPPAGALVFWLPKSGYSKTYSHITIAVDSSGSTVSSSDSVNKSAIHYETIAQHQASGAYNQYVGWWLPA